MREQTESRTPRSLLEDEEDEMRQEAHGVDRNEMAVAIGKMLAWLTDAPNVKAVGVRVYVMAHKLRPDLIGGISLHEIAKKLGPVCGPGRSSTHKLSKEFESLFGVHGIHDRSAEARKKYSEAYHRVNGYKPHSYNPLKKP